VNTPKDALVIGAIGAAVLLLVGWNVRKARRARHWRQTTGRIISAEVKVTNVLSDGDANIDVAATFAYTVHGRDYVGDRLALFTMQTRYSSKARASRERRRLPPGTEIPVWYDPANPADAVSNRDMPRGWWFAGVIGALMFFGALVPFLLGRLRA
jgi:hypothetical protein